MKDLILKSCPFCGEYPVIGECRFMGSTPIFSVACSTEDCHMSAVDTGWWDTKRKAIETWNTRHESKSE